MTEFYQDPDNQEPAGPVAARRVSGCLIRWTERTHAPETATVNVGSLPRIIKEAR